MTSSYSSDRANQASSYKHLTTSEYARQCNANPPRRVPFTRAEIQHYAELYVHHMSIAQAQNVAMAHDPEEIALAYVRVQPIIDAAQQKAKPLGLCTYAEIDASLEDFAKKCERKPRNFDDRILIATYAMTYVNLLDTYILNHPIRSQEDGLKVLDVANEELDRIGRLTLPNPLASPNVAPRVAQRVVLIPPTLRTSATVVTDQDLQRWKRHPLELVGLGFINTSSDNLFADKDSVFVVKDLMSSARGSRHFDVQFEDSGEDLFPFGLEDVFELIATANYVRVEAELPEM